VCNGAGRASLSVATARASCVVRSACRSSSAYIEHYLRCKQQAPATTSAVLVVPKSKRLTQLLLRIDLVEDVQKRYTHLQCCDRFYASTRSATCCSGFGMIRLYSWHQVACLKHQKLRSAVTLHCDARGSLRLARWTAGVKCRVQLDTAATHSFVTAHFVEHALASV